MSYVPLTWVSGSTKLGPTNLNHLETGLQSAAAVADSASVLAAAALPTPAGSNGQFLKRVGGVWVPTSLAASDLAGLVDRSAMAAGNKTTVGTLAAGPPGSPSDGDVWIATTVDANGTRWAFQYNSGSASANKWEFIGGPPAVVKVTTAESANFNNAWGDLATVGPTFTCARAGDYFVVGTADGAVGVGPDVLFAGVAIGAGTPAVDARQQNVASASVSMAVQDLVTGVTAASTLRLRYKAGNQSDTWSNRVLSVLPVRVA